MDGKSHFLESLEMIEARAQEGPITLHDIFEKLGVHGHLVLALFLVLPFLQPIPLPGLSVPMGLMITVIAVLNYLNKPPWLPKRFRNRVVSRELLLNILKVAEKLWSFLERFLHPRWPIFFQHPFFRVSNTLVLCVQALLLCLPLPIPFSNNVPALVIAVNLVGELEEDGLVVLVSYFLFWISVAAFVALAFGVEHGLDRFF